MSSSDDRSNSIIAVSAAMISIMSFAILGRLYTRLFIVKWVGVDDCLILVAALFALAEGIAPIVATQYGLGLHHTEQSPESVPTYMKLTLTASFSYSASNMFIKLSLLAFYLRLAPNNRSFRVAVYIMMFISAGFGIGSILSAGFQCIPLSMLWEIGVSGKCFDVVWFYFANSAINIVTDMIIYLMPIPTLWKLQLPVVQRIGLCAVLGLGGLVVVASICRITSLRVLLHSPDITWNVVSPLNWSTIELDIAIFATCVPAFKACIRHHLPSLLGSSRNGASRTYTNNNTATNTLTKSRHRSIPLGSVVRSESGEILQHHHHYTRGDSFRRGQGKSTTTVVGAFERASLGFPEGWRGSMERAKGGIRQHTSIRVDYEDGNEKRARSGISSLYGSEDRV